MITPKYYLSGLLLFFALAFMTSGCRNSQTEFDKMDWMNGRWENENEGIKTIEIWKRIPGGEFQVRGFMLDGADTLFAENIHVASKQGAIFYTVTISEQNNGKPIPFKLTENTGKKSFSKT